MCHKKDNISAIKLTLSAAAEDGPMVTTMLLISVVRKTCGHARAARWSLSTWWRQPEEPLWSL
eukprot:12719788-Heterocapsa_arctica.AAC.1